MCAARGYVAGIGLHLAAAADFTVVADDATLWEPFAQRGLHARQRRHLAAAASRSAWRGPASCCSSAAGSPAPRPPSGSSSTGRCPPPRSTPTAGRAGRRSWPPGPRSRSASPSGCCTRAKPRSLDAHLADEAFALELSSRSEDFREGLSGLLGEARPRLQGSVAPWTASTSTATTPPADAAERHRARGSTSTCPRRGGTAAAEGGAAAIRRGPQPRTEYEAWYPTFAAAGLVVADLAGRVRRPRRQRRGRAGHRRRAAPYNLGSAQPARA